MIDEVVDFEYINNSYDLIAGSMDVVGLYINVKPKRVGEEVTECIKESNWKCEVNTDELGKFTTLLLRRDKIIELGLKDCTPTIRDPTKIPDFLWTSFMDAPLIISSAILKEEKCGSG